jgi:hypothetical protein
LASMGGACLVNTTETPPDPWWSQPWRTHIDTGAVPAPTTGTSPELQFPAHADLFVEATPRMQWLPLAGANRYRVEISRDPSFSSLVISPAEIVPYPAYTPQTSLAQRSLGKTEYGTFYWRVQALNGSTPVGSVSQVRRFQIASQSEWKLTRTLGSPDNRLIIASDPSGDAGDNNYDLTHLYASQSHTDWFFGFNVNTAATDMSYVLYIDLDYQDNSGATLDARSGYNVTTNLAHRPEYAIYVDQDQDNGTFTKNMAYVSQWLGSSWSELRPLSNISAAELYYNGTNYVELKIPLTAISIADKNTASLALYSMAAGGGYPRDVVPSNSQASTNGIITRFTSVSERVNLVMPPTTPWVQHYPTHRSRLFHGTTRPGSTFQGSILILLLLTRARSSRSTGTSFYKSGGAIDDFIQRQIFRRGHSKLAE